MRQLAARTRLHQSTELSGRCNGARVFVKREDLHQFSSTVKDRRSTALVEKRSGKTTVFVQITSGNSGLSIGEIVKDKADPNMKVVNIVDKKMPKKMKERLRTCSIVVEMDLSKGIISDDEKIDIAKRAVGTETCDENIILVDEQRLQDGYRQIVDEIRDQLPEVSLEEVQKPNYIFCPIGGGELITELLARVLEIWPEDPPKIVGVTIPDNPIAARYFSSDRKRFLGRVRRAIADKLGCAYTTYADGVLSAIRDGKIELMVAREEKEIAREYAWLNEIGIPVEPSAAVAFWGAVNFGAYEEQPTHGFGSEDTVVIINTGKGLYDKTGVDKLWKKRLMNGLKYLGVFLAGAAVVGIMSFGYIRGEIKYQAIYRTYLEDRMVYYASKDKTKFPSHEEIMEVCRMLGDDCVNKYGTTPKLLDEFSVLQMVFYTKLMEYQSWNDVAGRETAIIVRQAWDEGRLREDGTIVERQEPGKPYYEKGEPGESGYIIK